MKKEIQEVNTSTQQEMLKGTEERKVFSVSFPLPGWLQNFSNSFSWSSLIGLSDSLSVMFTLKLDFNFFLFSKS